VAGDIRYALFTIIVVTLDILFLSVPLQIPDDVPAVRIALHFVLPYVIVFVLIGIGMYRRERKARQRRIETIDRTP